MAEVTPYESRPRRQGRRGHKPGDPTRPDLAGFTVSNGIPIHRAEGQVRLQDEPKSSFAAFTNGRQGAVCPASVPSEKRADGSNWRERESSVFRSLGADGRPPS